MGSYGVTPLGVNIKRLDAILDELHASLSGSWGVNTRLNPKSLLNVQLTVFADKIAELWEFGEQVYHSLYPFSAEGSSLDNAIQFGGVTREEARPTYYPVHCECVDGTVIKRGTLIKTDTNPAVQLAASADAAVTRGACNRAKIRVAVVQEAVYAIALDGKLYSRESGSGESAEEILSGLAGLIDSPKFETRVEGGLLVVESVDRQEAHDIVLSGNLTTHSVTGIVNFGCEQPGEVALPDGTISHVVTAAPGLLGVANMLPYIAGRTRQTDVGVRKSYVDKIYARSNRMIESIKGAILNNVQGVKAVAGYQNDAHTVDGHGRWPHCVEIVADGGADGEIAQQIWDKKTDGIQTYGSTEVVLPGDEGEPVTIRFSRPAYLHIWWRIEIAISNTEPLPPNYADAIRGIVLGEMSKAEPGKPVFPQKLVEHRIYAAVPGIAAISTATFRTEDANEQPGVYAAGMVLVSPRQRAVTDAARIEVVLGG